MTTQARPPQVAPDSAAAPSRRKDTVAPPTLLKALRCGWQPAALGLVGGLLWVGALAVWPVGMTPDWFTKMLGSARGPASPRADLLWAVACGGALLALAQAGLAGWLALQRQRQLAQAVASTLAQARALGDPTRQAKAQFREALEVPELAPLAQGMRQLRERLRALFDLHAEQLESLRLQAHNDAVTGLPNQRHFTAMLEGLLSGDHASPQAGLVMLRLDDLQGLNQRLGRDATDQVLKAIGSVLHTYPQRVARCVVGRLAGADFALLLPVGGMADETLQSLTAALRQPLLSLDPAIRLQGGATELALPMAMSEALSRVHATLAARALTQAQQHAEPLPVLTLPAGLYLPMPAQRAGSEALPTIDPRLVSADPPASADADTAQLPESAWQRRLLRALSHDRVQLGAVPVCTADGRQLHLLSPLRVQLIPGGAYEPASRWLALAMSSRMSVAVDQRAVELALIAMAGDGQARCVSIHGPSAATASFVEQIASKLEAMPAAAGRLWVDLPESLALAQPLAVQELARRWRPLGVMLGLSQAGEHLLRLPRLTDLGLDCVRIDARFVNGISAEHNLNARRYLEGLVRLAHSVGLSVSAEGVRSPRDLDLLWSMGFDAAAGPALQASMAAAA